MSAPIFITAPTRQPQKRNPLLAIVGLVLTLPAVAAWLYSLVAPTWRTWQFSTRNGHLPTLEQGAPVGLENYHQILANPAFRQALHFTLSVTIERTLIVALVPLVFALLVNEFGRTIRTPLRLLFTIPLAMFSPVGLAIVWLLALNPQFGLLRGGQNALVNTTLPGNALRWVDGISTAVLACGTGLTIYLLALRGAGGGAPRSGRVIPAVLVTWLIAIFATVALTLQTFTLSYVLTGGVPGGQITTVALYEYQVGFQQLQTGLAGAMACLILLACGVLGLLSGVLILASNLRLELVPADKPAGLLPRRSKPLAAIALLLATTAGLALLVYWARPVLWAVLTSFKSPAEAMNPNSPFFPAHRANTAYRRLHGMLSQNPTLRNTVLPPLLSVIVIQLPIAYLGAFGIGALRPLGRFSEWLLLPFSPWLFVTAGPLSIGLVTRLIDAGRLNSYVALAPPLLLNVPMLVILTLGFKGSVLRRQQARHPGQLAASNFLTAVILPSLPLAVIVAAVTLLIDFQDLLWPLLTATSPKYWTVSQFLLNSARQLSALVPVTTASITYFGLLFFAIFFLIFGLFQIFYFDRLALVVGSRQ